jgi:hypothetical protein
MAKPIVAFRNFPNAPKKRILIHNHITRKFTLSLIYLSRRDTIRHKTPYTSVRFLNNFPEVITPFLLITNLAHFFQCIYLFPLSTCFEQPSAHRQENQIVSIQHLVYINLCRWLPGMPVRKECIDTIWFSWWLALGCSKLVGKGNKYIEKSASSWLLTRIIPRCTVNEI